MTQVTDSPVAAGAPRTTAALATRRAAVYVVLVAGTVLLTLFALGTGEYPLSPGEVIHALTDPGAGFDRTVVLEWRVPRIGVALLVGAALGVSGALFQSLTANPLGSPDVIGFTTGANTGAIIAITVLGTGVSSAAGGALIGGLLVAGAVLTLSWRGGIDSFRLIIVGIGATALLQAVNRWLLLRARTEVAMTASIWESGTLATADRARLVTGAVGIGVLLLLTLAIAAPLRQLELGDDLARAHGLRAQLARVLVLVIGVALVAVTVAVAGPITFIALTAPPIAAALLRSSGLPLAASGLVGSLIVLAADQLVTHVVPGNVPVGTVTIVVGGIYLLVLLIREVRRW